MTRVARLLTLLALVLCLTQEAEATTWGPEEVVCPVCEHTNEFEAPMSSGSYIYRWPSRFHFVFWPATESRSIYSCAECHLTCLMWDFRSVPAEKVEELRAALEGVELPAGPYHRIPILEKLAVAERVYEVLGQTPHEWCWFYRVVGYHAQETGDQAAAVAAWERALELALELLDEAGDEGNAKELRLIAGAMRHHLGDDAGAREEFELAQALVFVNEEDPRQAEGFNEYVDELLGDYLRLLDE
jgi:hypothetical protein